MKTIKRYVKKPIVITALQWKGDNYEEIASFCQYIDESERRTMCFLNGDKLWIRTKEGQLKASVGDFIIRGIQGEFYPCDYNIFLQTYDEVAE